MGGKALNKYGVQTLRMNTNEFVRIGKIVQESFNLHFNIPVETKIVTCYHNKPTHGDLDLLIKIDDAFHNSGIDLREYIRIAFEPKAIHNNGGVYSFDFMNFQIDFIPVKQSSWETAKTYYSYDPLGNIMGKTFHKFNLSYGWNGLYYKFRNFNGNNSQNILISNDAEKIFKFGGYDYERYLQGFDDLEDILKFTVNSKYFDTQIFQMDNLKSIDKKRNRKRASYHVFLKYLEDNDINVTYPFDRNKDVYLKWIDAEFPEAKLLEKLEVLRMKDKENKIVAQKFNGDLVMSWLPHLQGKQLGAAIRRFKESVLEDFDSYNDYVLNATFSDIQKRFMNLYDE